MELGLELVLALDEAFVAILSHGILNYGSPKGLPDFAIGLLWLTFVPLVNSTLSWREVAAMLFFDLLPAA